MTDRLDVVGIGNAIVDVLARVEEPFLAAQGVPKAAMRLVGEAEAAALYDAMPPGREISGGSVANTIAGVAALGHRAGFVGKVADDQLGRIFAHDIRAQGVAYGGPVAAVGGDTARCLVLVTPDGERSMSTCLGISGALRPDEIDEDLVARADWVMLEGYLFDSDASKEAYARAIAAVRRGGGQVAFSVSDPFCVDRHREDMQRLVREEVDLLFANRAELAALYGTEDLEAGLAAAAGEVEMAAVTLSGEGAVMASGAARHPVPAAGVAVVDTTGAGDLFAAGVLAGLARGHGPAEAARMGCIAAAEVISHLGARPEADLRALMTEAGL